MTTQPDLSQELLGEESLPVEFPPDWWELKSGNIFC